MINIYTGGAEKIIVINKQNMTVDEFAKELFKMYSGEIVHLGLQFKGDLINPLFDKFGEQTNIKKIDEKVI